jgi:beta-lactamase superfamily II metal-dependent hydrolase
MASKPTSIEIRGYNVGFGDCFLLTFHYAKGAKQVLIDFGTTKSPGTLTPAQQQLKIAAKIKEVTGGRLDAIIATHRHADHISGFATGSKGDASGDVIKSLTDATTIVLQPWTEDPAAPKDSKGDGSKALTARGKAFAAQLEDMHGVAESIAAEARRMSSESMDVDTQETIATPAENSKRRAAPVTTAGDDAGSSDEAAALDSSEALPASALTARTGSSAGKRLRDKLSFIGEDNVKNLSAVKNLMSIGSTKTRHYLHYGADSGLESILPGVKVHVLGPPTIEQWDQVQKERSKDPAEFWQLRHAFWQKQSLAQTQRLAAGDEQPPKPAALFPKAKIVPVPRPARWFVRRLRGVRAKQLLEMVLVMDTAMNNTSLILLFEVGDKKLLFPGDAQIENWEYALKHAKETPKILKLLADVDVYKVGHHGSLNATPKTLWATFKNRTTGAKKEMTSLISTKAGKHGSTERNTEVPRRTLVEALKAETDYKTTQDLKAANEELCIKQVIEL